MTQAQMTYRLTFGGARKWFATYEEAKKAQRKHKGRLAILMPEGDAGNPLHWIEL